MEVPVYVFGQMQRAKTISTGNVEKLKHRAPLLDQAEIILQVLKHPSSLKICY